MIILRQISAKLVNGNEQSDNVAERVWNFQDVEARYKLIQTEGKASGGSCLVPTSDFVTLELPPNYDPTKILWCLISAYGEVKCETTLVDATVQKQLIFGDSQNEGVTAFGDHVASIKITNPSGSDGIFIEFSFFEQPDLSSMDSYLGNFVTYGENTNRG